MDEIQFVDEHFDPDLWWKIPLTYCVPFCVATYGALANARRTPST